MHVWDFVVITNALELCIFEALPSVIEANGFFWPKISKRLEHDKLLFAYKVAR